MLPRRNRNVRVGHLLLHRITSVSQLLGRRRGVRRIVILGNDSDARSLTERLSDWYLTCAPNQSDILIETTPTLRFSDIVGSRRLCLLTASAPVGGRTVLAALMNRLRIADEERFSSAASIQLARLAHYDLQSREILRNASALETTRLRSLSARLPRTPVAQVFGTGPSLDRVVDCQVRDEAFRIACNSAVASTSILEVIRPHGFVFGDPAFHFGPSSYALRFREELDAWLLADPERWALVPREFAPLLIGLEASSQIYSVRLTALWKLFGLPKSVNDRFPRTGNILTQSLLPLAGCTSEHVEVFGCDGREPKDNGFWQLSSSNLAEKYSSVQQAHPGFFDRVSYTDYYELHCRRLEVIVSSLERRSMTVCSRTPSFIPALSRRLCV